MSSGCIDLERLRATADGGGGADGGGLVSRCPGLGVQLCDGFEGATLDPRWNMVTHSGTVSIDDAFAARGAHSLAVEALGGASGDVQADTESETFPSTDIYMRELVYLRSTRSRRPRRITAQVTLSADRRGCSPIRSTCRRTRTKGSELFTLPTWLWPQPASNMKLMLIGVPEPLALQRPVVIRPALHELAVAVEGVVLSAL